MVKDIGHFIGGKTSPAASGRFADVYNPNTGEVQARVALASQGRSARRGRERQGGAAGWAATNPQRRARVMMKFLDLANAHRDELAEHHLRASTARPSPTRTATSSAASKSPSSPAAFRIC